MKSDNNIKKVVLFGRANDLETKKMVDTYFHVFAKDTVKMMDDPANLLASLREYFSKWQLQRAGQAAANFVHVTNTFISATSLDPAFAKMRADNLDDRIIAEKLNQNGRDIAKIIADFRNHKDASADEKRLVDDVFGHCMKMINDRIKGLQASNNKIYHVYSSQENVLRSFIETNQSSLKSQNRL